MRVREDTCDNNDDDVGQSNDDNDAEEEKEDGKIQTEEYLDDDINLLSVRTGHLLSVRAGHLLSVRAGHLLCLTFLRLDEQQHSRYPRSSAPHYSAVFRVT